MASHVDQVKPQVHAHAGPLGLLGWRLLNVLQLAYAALWSAGWITVALITLAVSGNRRWPLRMAARCWAPGLLWGAGAGLSVDGCERIDWSRAHVFVANHQSIIDVCALFCALPTPLRFLLKRELSRVPFLGQYARATGMIFIQRGAGRSASSQLHRAAELLCGGASLCAFPEGTRSRGGGVAPFKNGSFQAAIDAGVAVVPVAILGSGAVLPAGGFCVRPGRIQVRIGRSLPTAELQARDRNLLAGQARQAIMALRREDASAS